MNVSRQREIWRNARARYYESHKEICLERVKKLRKRYRDEGRCEMCSIQLLQDEKRWCVNCSGKFKKEKTYAASFTRLTEIV